MYCRIDCCTGPGEVVRARIASELLLCYALQCMCQPTTISIALVSAYQSTALTILVMVTVVVITALLIDLEVEVVGSV